VFLTGGKGTKFSLRLTAETGCRAAEKLFQPLLTAAKK
jgi:hypothetical protein